MHVRFVLFAALAVVLVFGAASCTGEVENFCNNENPCENPERPFCDFAGDFGPSNTCIPVPFDAGVPGPDGASADASSTPADTVDAGLPDATPPCECTPDTVACTTDVCELSGGDCTAIPTHDNCTDPDAPFCHPTEGCVAQTCESAADCDDGLFCNGTETCDIAAGETVGLCRPGSAPTCNDGIACTVDTCDPGMDACKFTPDNAACDDGAFCNGAETCSATLGCRAGTPPVVNDGIGCTIDSCNESADRIDHIADSSACNDGLFCNGTETCSVTADCQAGTPPALSDGIACTLDSCNEVADRVDHTPSNAACDDGGFCNGTETCSATLGCQAGTPPVTNDGIACTSDSCDEALDVVVHTPVDSVCDDGLFCNGDEVCSATAGCQSGTPPILSDGVSCTTDTCDESSNTIVHTAEDSLCDDGLHCNGAESCDADAGCQSGVAPICSASDVCIASNSCNEATNSCNPVQAQFDITYLIFGVGSGSEDLTCVSTVEVHTDPNGCGAGVPMRYLCGMDDEGKLSARAAGTFVPGSLPCLGPAGPEVTSGCSEISFTDETGGHIFRCCFD